MGKILFMLLGHFLLQVTQNQLIKAYLIKYEIQFIIQIYQILKKLELPQFDQTSVRNLQQICCLMVKHLKYFR